jgi:hypothetical protein
MITLHNYSSLPDEQDATTIGTTTGESTLVLNDLSSVFFGHSAKIKNTQQKKHSAKKRTRQRSFFAECFFSLDKDKFQSTF